MANDPLVLLKTFSSDAEAHIVAGMLESNDIPSVIDNETFSAVLPIGFNSIGGIRLMVFQRDQAKALALLAADND